MLVGVASLGIHVVGIAYGIRVQRSLRRVRGRRTAPSSAALRGMSGVAGDPQDRPWSAPYAEAESGVSRDRAPKPTGRTAPVNEDPGQRGNRVGPVGIEPTTRGLKVRCSAS